MTTQITVTLPDSVLRRAEVLAQRTGRAVADVLAETIELSLRPLGTAAGEEIPATDWSDADRFVAAPGPLESLADVTAAFTAGFINDYVLKTSVSSYVSRFGKDAVIAEAKKVASVDARRLIEDAAAPAK